MPMATPGILYWGHSGLIFSPSARRSGSLGWRERDDAPGGSAGSASVGATRPMVAAAASPAVTRRKPRRDTRRGAVVARCIETSPDGAVTVPDGEAEVAGHLTLCSAYLRGDGGVPRLSIMHRTGAGEAKPYPWFHAA